MNEAIGIESNNAAEMGGTTVRTGRLSIQVNAAQDSQGFCEPCTCRCLICVCRCRPT